LFDLGHFAERKKERKKEVDSRVAKKETVCVGGMMEQTAEIVAPKTQHEVVRSIVINPSVCVFVCLSASISLETLDRPSRNFVCRSPVAVDRSSSSDVAIRYVLPVYE